MIKIIGAGMSGLLCANMLRHRDPIVIESAAALPNNHSALLRFSSNVVGDVLGIPFKRVNVIKSVVPWQNPVADAMAYSQKVTGSYDTTRSVARAERMETSERFIAPPDLISRMAKNVNIEFNNYYKFEDKEKVISTIPMPMLKGALRYSEHLKFGWLPGVNIRAKVRDCSSYCTLMVPDPELLYSRVSITGDDLIVELSNFTKKLDQEEAQRIAYEAGDLLGIDHHDLSGIEVSEQKYAKILPIDEHERKSFIYWASTQTSRAFSLGRYATWRPGLLLDDLVKDIRLIDSWIDNPSSRYDQSVIEMRGRK